MEGTAGQPTPAPAAAPSPAPQQAGFSVPDGYELVSKEYKTQAERWREQIAPGQRWGETAKKAGFEKPEDFAEWSEFLGEARKRKLSPKALASIYSGDDDPVQDQKQPLQSLTAEDVQRLIAEETGAIRAEQEYNSLSAREKAALEAQVDEIAGPDATAWEKRLVKSTLQYEAALARQEYDEKHPLRKKGYFQPLDETGIGSLKSKLQKERDEAKAAALAAKGKAASDKKPSMISTPAGSSGGQGKADNNGKPSKPFHQLSRGERLAAMEQMKARQGGSTLA